MPSTDPLDAADFNPTAHINRLFPNEESLSEVDAHVGGLQDRMREFDQGLGLVPCGNRRALAPCPNPNPARQLNLTRSY